MRYEFGAGMADFVVQPSDGLWGIAPAAVVTFHSASTGGTQYTDLLDAGSNPITQVVADSQGFLPRFQGPDGVVGMWASAGGTSRAWIEAHNTGTTEAAAGSVRDWLNVLDFGAVGDNVTDSWDAIQDALNTAPMGGIVYVPAGAFRTSQPLTIPPAVTLMGTHSNLMSVVGLVDPPCYIKPLPSFTGDAVIKFLDQDLGGYSTISAEHRITRLMIDGDDLAVTADGIQAKGNIQNVRLEDVTIRKVSGNGIYTGLNAGFFPYSWRCHRVMIDNCGAHGVSVQVMTDITLVDCQAIGNASNGFEINNAANSQMIGCRAEWNGNNGYHITGDWATGTGSGGMLVGDCSTDRNGFNGLLIDATGNPPIQIENLHTRRDGRNGGTGGGGYAGLKVDGATVPVLVGMVTCFPGVDDNGTMTNSPQYGARFEDSAYVSVASGFLHAATAGWSDGGGNTVLRRSPNIGERTGTTAAPVDDFDNAWAAAGYAALDSGQSNGAWNIWGNTAQALKLGSAGGGIAIAEGTNARMGVATLTGTTPVTIANTSVTANTRVGVFRQTATGTLGHLSVTKNAGANFTIQSSAAETSTVFWILFEPAA